MGTVECKEEDFMFYDSKQFAVLNGSLQALSIQQQAILHNLANPEGPDLHR